MKPSSFSLSLLAIIAGLMLAACGGGSGGGGGAAAPPPAIPTGLTATAKDGYVLLDANVASDVTGVNIYWSTASGVSKTTGTKIIVGSSPQAHTGLTNGTPYYYVVTALNAGGESAATAQISATPVAVAMGLTDPLYVYQWHLKNTGQKSATGIAGTLGEDMHVEPVWTLPAPIKGSGIRIAVVDDGLEIGHEDLASNVAANEFNYNYATGSNDPTNSPSDLTSGHGTEVAGILAARDSNGKGVSGVAPRANLVGYNLLQNNTSSNEVDAMTRNAASVSVSSNSWGSADGTGELTASSSLWQTAINTGLTTGRDGKGTIYMWAAGNGRAGSDACPACSDNSNYDGRANYRGVMAVAAVNDQGVQSAYSESGANLWVSAPGGEFCSTHTITTTDRTGAVGKNTTATAGTSDYPDPNFTKCMNGTSAATPGAAGVVALMLAANPNLGWRDVRIILAQTARVNDWVGGGWVPNGGTPNYYVSHKYGFGVVDAAEAVKAAQGLTTYLGPELTHSTLLSSPAKPIPEDMTGVSDTIIVTGSSISSIEFVEITFTATNSPYSGDLDVTLTSPNGTVSQLAEPHVCGGTSGACTSSYDGWVFGSARHLGEAADGSWTLTVKDGYAGNTGTFSSWKLKFYGH